MPFTVHSTCPAPASIAARELASVHPRTRGRPHRLTGEVDVPVVTARERGDHGTTHRLGNRPHTPPVALRRAREPRFDHVHTKRIQLAGETQLLLGRHRIARRLLAVAQGGIEDDDVSPHGWLPGSVSRVDGEKKAADLLWSAALTASFLYRLPLMCLFCARRRPFPELMVSRTRARNQTRGSCLTSR